MHFLEIGESEVLIIQAANVLYQAFNSVDKNSWKDFESAKQEVLECIEKPNICLGICEKNKLLGWIGLRPMYEKTWELHPLAVRPEIQRKGIGKFLIEELEKRAKKDGIIGIALGTDDETERTSLSKIDIDENNIFNEIKNIREFKKSSI